MERQGKRVNRTYEANPGEVWEESEFFIDLSWRMDQDGSLGIRKHFESPNRPGEPISVDEYFGWIFDHSVPGLPEAAKGRRPDASGLHAQVRRIRGQEGLLPAL